MANDRANLRKLLDRVADLLVQYTTVGDHDHRIKNGLAAFLDANQLMRQPSNRVTLPAAGGMLNQVTAPRAVFFCVAQQRPDDRQLMIARENLPAFLAPLFVLLFQ